MITLNGGREVQGGRVTIFPFYLVALVAGTASALSLTCAAGIAFIAVVLFIDWIVVVFCAKPHTPRSEFAPNELTLVTMLVSGTVCGLVIYGLRAIL